MTRPGIRSLAAAAAGLVAASLLAPASPAAADPATRERIPLESGWSFHRGDPDAAPGRDELKPWVLPSGNAFIPDPERRHARPPGDPRGDTHYAAVDFDDRHWETVRVPHDWAIPGPFLESGPHGGMGRLESWGVGWYRRQLDIPASAAGRKIFLDVDGAMAYAGVWLNGYFVGGWPYGYASWRLDLTPYADPGGRNQLAIRLENPPESSRWYPGAGLYRKVWLTTTHAVRVGQWGTFVRTPDVSADSASVRIDVAIDNDSVADVEVDVSTEIVALDDTGMPHGDVVATITSRGVRVAGRDSTTARGVTRIRDPRLWGPPPRQRPQLYRATTVLRMDGEPIDRYETDFGIREIRFDPDRGIVVNGEHVPLHGVNNHHDLGALGAAFNVRAAERQLEILQAMGANALRTSHNPPAPELLDLADRMGILVVDEIFDVWQRQKTPFDFHLVFDDWHEPDLRAFIRRDRNHPSVILWSVGNEVGEQTTGEAGAAIAARLAAIAREEDPTRPVTTAMNWANAGDPMPAVMDVINLNYQGVGIRTLPSDFPAYRREYPDKVVFSSESASALSSRGEYQFPVSGSVSGPVRPGVGGDPDTRHVSAYELYAADFGSSADQSFSLHDQHPWVAGEFVWTGFDYLGEPTPYYSSRSSYSGIVDLAGFPKDRYYLYQSRWRPELPMAHILPHWTWPGREGLVTPVHVFTSGDEAELFLNGESLGRRKKAPYQYRLRWDYVEYQPGVLEVVAYRDGREWATTSVRTAGEPARLELSVDRERIAADGRDLAFVTLRVTDAAGLTAPRAADEIAFSIDGPGEIVATDNGDPTSFVPFGSPRRKAFNGFALAIVRGIEGQAGVVTVRAASASLQGASVEIASAPAD